METISTFFEMGGYGPYIWPGYAVSAILMIGVFITSIRTLKTNRTILAKLEDPAVDLKNEDSINNETQA